MSHPYDASTKYLVQTRLADWLELCGRRTTAATEIIDSDLATVTAVADKVLRIHEDPAWLLHLELQASRDPGFVANLPAYNVLLERQHRLPVRTVVVLLRPAADARELNGTIRREFPGEVPYLLFRFQVVRIWQEPVETFLNGGFGILPLAPLSAVAADELPGVINRIDQRLDREATTEEAGMLWTATDVLMGLRWPRELVAQLFRGVHGMRESVTYQAIVEEGKVAAMQENIIRLGSKRFGSPDSATLHTVRGLTDVDRLNRIHDRLLEASSWVDLLSTT